jgi:hypothetical protein
VADSVSEDLGDKAKAAVEALALAGTPTVEKRKQPGVPEGVPLGTGGQISVTVLEDRGQPLDALRRLETYKLVIVIVRGGGSKAADDPTVRKWRKLIEEAVDDKDLTTFAGLGNGAEINRASYVGGALPFDAAAALKDYVYSALNFEVEVIETRAT